MSGFQPIYIKKTTANHSAAFSDLEVSGSYDQCLKEISSLTNVLKFGTSLPQPLLPVSETIRSWTKKKFKEIGNIFITYYYVLLKFPFEKLENFKFLISSTDTIPMVISSTEKLVISKHFTAISTKYKCVCWKSIYSSLCITCPQMLLLWGRGITVGLEVRVCFGCSVLGF